MKWSIHQLRKSSYSGFTIDETITLDEIFERKTDLVALSPVHVTGKMDYSEKKITFHLNISGVMTLPCSRTLNPVEYPFEIPCMETFFRDASYVGDEDGLVLENDVVDLRPIILENVVLEIPLQVFSTAVDNERVAPKSGNDWSLITEEQFEKEQAEQKPKVDSRLAGLANIFQDNNKSQ